MHETRAQVRSHPIAQFAQSALGVNCNNPARRGMADDMDVAQAAHATVLDRFPMRDEDGDIRSEFVEKVSAAVQAADAAFLREVVAELHEADLGDLIEALDPEERPRL